MGDLMPDRFGNKLLELFHAPGHALVRSLINRDLIRHAEALAHAANGERSPVIQAQQAAPRRLGLDDNDDIVEALAESAGDALEGALHELIEIGCA